MSHSQMTLQTWNNDTIDTFQLTQQIKNLNQNYGHPLIEQDHIQKIIRLQSLVRAFIAKRNYQVQKFMKQSITLNTRYFTLSEAQETITKCNFNNKVYIILAKLQIIQKRVRKVPYVYKSTGSVYDGEWLGNFRDGFGIMTWIDGAQYIGNWSYNKACGKGQFIHAEGDIYDGEWYADKAQGYGVYKHVNGALYQGQWKEDLQHGHGYEKWVDGSSYLGGYVDGFKQGIGFYKWNDGSDYEGEWHQNKINGGTYTWLDGRRYEGQWSNNNMHGIGYYRWGDGRTYEGEYKDDKKHGFGIYQWSDGRIYMGYWQNGKQHGLGTFKTQTDPQLKFGLWEDGKRIQWFEDEITIKELMNKQYDYSELYTLASSIEVGFLIVYSSYSRLRNYLLQHLSPQKIFVKDRISLSRG
ncbi:UNKNOWN [Stylonychia lemnae]|uniref:Morn repeat protein n=1 Tax=Stylonychia lemnae TaxID=5949 RepID=A0A078AH69_STYLE|nr:UNKNOWN [Stylonychia lemnae]|eukprot:CDW81630.1 UNKNOWN [Stylonychia lemnae]